MAATLNLGNGDWGTKENSLLGYNSENDNFKPLPFDVTRATSSSRVNKLGLIENVTNNIAAIDYQGNINGALLTQPQSTNLITYPVSFGNSYWTKSGASIEGDASTAGSELVTNGDFATDSDWVKQGTITISGGAANFVSEASGNALFQAGVNLVEGKTYVITYTITSITEGAIAIRYPNFTTSRTQAGTYTEYQVATSAGWVGFRAVGTTTGSVDNVSVKEVQGFTSPSADYPTSAFKLVEGSGNVSHFIYSENITVTLGTVYSSFVFAKKGENNRIQLTYGSSAFNDSYANFDLNLGTVLLTNNSTATIEPLANGYYKCSIIATCTKSGNNQLVPSLINSDTATRLASYTGDGTSGVYIFGAQLEQLSYPTSLIYNGVEGSTVTRVGDQVSQSGLSNIINSVEGTLFVETSFLSTGVTDGNGISISDGTNDNILKYYTYSGLLYMDFKVGGVLQASIYTSAYSIDVSNKIAASFKSNEFKLYINGVQVGSTDVSVNVPSGNTLDTLYFRGNPTSSSSNLLSKVKDIRVFTTALSDAELTTLTTI